tara:strand:+ start:157 stop:648 length:492 start_codon:yes stop_codon:yes gene_type:complete
MENTMQFKTLEGELRDLAYPTLFGAEMMSCLPLYSLTESAFYNGMDQMVCGYDGGYYEYVVPVEEDDTSIYSPLCFFPLIDQVGETTVSTPMADYEMSFQAACVAVWVLLLSQMAELTKVDSVRKNIYNVLNDVKHIYARLKNADGEMLFTKSDINAISAILD